MSKKITLEEAYFHICNGGIAIKFVEQHDERESREYPPPVPGETIAQSERRMATPLRIGTNYNRRWFVEVKMMSYGASTTFRFPLGNPLFIAWLMSALPRVLGRMMMDDGRPTDGFEYPFRDTFKAGVSAWDGRKVKFDWPHTVDGTSEPHSGSTSAQASDSSSIEMDAQPALTDRQRFEASRAAWIEVLKRAGLEEWIRVHVGESLEERRRRATRYAVAWRFSNGHPWSLASTKPLDGRWATSEEARDAILSVIKNVTYSVEYAVADTHKNDSSGQPVVGVPVELARIDKPVVETLRRRR